ncbi:MAG: hypothetical protein ACE141_13685 [Bryobacteraceae bacterium]
MLSAESPDWWLAKRLRVALILAALAVLAYLPAQGLPFISDDYPHIHLARQYGPISGWPELASDLLYRSRATSLVLSYWTERAFGLSPLAFHLSSLALHVLNVWLILLLGAWPRIGWKCSAAAAAFFAVHEGHQEAVIWYAAVHEEIHLVFALVCLHLWVRWLSARGAWLYVASICAYILALLSKESAVAVGPLLALVALIERAGWRRTAWAVMPFAVLAGLYFGAIYAGRATHGHFNDIGTFSLQAPFWVTWRNSMGRLFWIWGWLGVLPLAFWRSKARTALAFLGAAWAGITLLPYCFLTYMPRVPSRHTYFASVGLALAVAAAFRAFWERFQTRPWMGWTLAAVIILHNCVYLWTRKQSQFMALAAPTEQLVIFASQVEGPVYVHCFPYGFEAAERAVELRLGKQAYLMGPARPLSEIKDRTNVFCWTPREHWDRASD